MKSRERQHKESGLLLLGACLAMINLILISIIINSKMCYTLKGVLIATIVYIVVEVFKWVIKYYNRKEGKK